MQVIGIAPSSRRLFPLVEEGVCTFMDGPDGFAVGGDSRQRPGAGAAGHDGAWRQTLARSSRCVERHPLGAADGCTLGRPPTALPATPDVPRPLSKVGARG